MTDEQKKEVDVLGEKYGKDELGAFYDKKTGKIYMNAATMTGSREDIIGTLANELPHLVDHKKRREFDQRRQDISTEYEEDARRQFADYNPEYTDEEIDREAFQEKMDQHDFSKGNDL